MTRSSDQALFAQLQEARRHVLAVVDGLDERAMRSSVVPSGWTPVQLLNHLAHDDEKFWISAVVGGDPDAVAGLVDGWAAGPSSGPDAVAHYREQIRRSDAVLMHADLDSRPSWRPDASELDTSDLVDNRAVLLRVIVETTTHAGHLDITRELLDGHQHLVLG